MNSSASAFLFPILLGLALGTSSCSADSGASDRGSSYYPPPSSPSAGSPAPAGSTPSPGTVVTPAPAGTSSYVAPGGAAQLVAPIPSNPFVRAESDPLSTFAADVD